MTHRKTMIRITAGFLSERVEARKQQNDSLKCCKKTLWWLLIAYRIKSKALNLHNPLLFTLLVIFCSSNILLLCNTFFFFNAGPSMWKDPLFLAYLLAWLAWPHTPLPLWTNVPLYYLFKSNSLTLNGAPLSWGLIFRSLVSIVLLTTEWTQSIFVELITMKD